MLRDLVCVNMHVCVYVRVCAIKFPIISFKSLHWAVSGHKSVLFPLYVVGLARALAQRGLRETSEEIKETIRMPGWVRAHLAAVAVTVWRLSHLGFTD